MRAVWFQIELCYLHIGLARRQVIVGEHALIHIGRADAHAQVAHPDPVVADRKQLLQQRRPSRSVHAHQQLRASSCQRKTKAVHDLEVLCIVHRKHR